MSVVNVPFAKGQDMFNDANNFYTRERVTVQTVTVTNHYQMKVTGNVFIPKSLNRDAKIRAIQCSTNSSR